MNKFLMSAGESRSVPTVIVYHDLPIESAIRGRLEDLTIKVAEDMDAVLNLLPGADILIVNPANWDDAFVNQLGEGDWVQATSVGYDTFPLDEFRERGVTFSNATGNYAPAVADHTFAMALAHFRDLQSLFKQQRNHVWERSIGNELQELSDRTLTVFGLGTIGEAIAKRGLGFKMEVLGIKRNPDDYDGCLPAGQVHDPDNFYEILPETDVLVSIVPLTEETHHAIDAPVFDRLPNTAFVINVARGSVIDEDALIKALESGKIAGAALDVFETEPLPVESPLWDRDDVLVTPHVAGRSDRFVDRFSSLFIENYRKWKQADTLRNEIVD